MGCNDETEREALAMSETDESCTMCGYSGVQLRLCPRCTGGDTYVCPDCWGDHAEWHGFCPRCGEEGCHYRECEDEDEEY